MTGVLRVCAAAALCAALCACGSSSPEAAPNVAFCLSADELFNNTTFGTDGSGVAESLRRMPLEGLVDDDQESISTAIDEVEVHIVSFNNAQSTDGWTTEPVATVATRICGKEMQSFYVAA